VSAFGGPFQPEGYEIEHSVSGHGRYCARAPTPTSFWYEKSFRPLTRSSPPHAGLLSFSRGLGGEIDSRFVITLADDARWADGRYEAFGRVSSSSADVLKKIEGVTVKPPTNRPEKPIMITGCGVSR
jgi:cyclophilin family peptidyl-prolyl cis-trans isomerase